MIKQSLFGMALALATASLAAQAPKPTTAPPKPTTAAPKTATPQPQKDENRYVPAIEQKLVTVSGCLKRGSDWELTDATIAGQQEKKTYKLEGIGDARLSLFVGQRVQATGALQDGGKSTTGKTLPRFEATAGKEATAVKEATGTTGTCS
jgi:hypothetical protein